MFVENQKIEDRIDDFIKLKIFCQKYPEAVTEGQIRWLIFTGRADYFMRKLGARRWLISPRRFFEWIEKNGEVASGQ
jgi:hypothetical protein